MRIFGKIPGDPAMFGDLYFMAMREVMEQDEEGKATGKLAHREYSLASSGQGMVVAVRVPETVPERKFKPNEKVEVVDPLGFPFTRGEFPDREVVWNVDVSDIVAVKTAPPPPGGPPNQNQGGGNGNNPPQGDKK